MMEMFDVHGGNVGGADEEGAGVQVGLGFVEALE
jgi:hypothetical protein